MRQIVILVINQHVAQVDLSYTNCNPCMHLGLKLNVIRFSLRRN